MNFVILDTDFEKSRMVLSRSPVGLEHGIAEAIARERQETRDNAAPAIGPDTTSNEQRGRAMNFGSLNCFRVAVPTTNSGDDCFSIDGKYYDCEEGFVYVMALNMAEAAKEIPNALEIRRVGFALQSRLPAGSGNES